MQKINSIGYGGKILGFASIFSLLIPGVLKLVSFFYKNSKLTVCARVSFGMGILIALFLFGLLAVELHQDKKRNQYYENHKNVKLSLGQGVFECQCCGSRAVKAEDRNCGICGILFKKDRAEEGNG